MSVRECTIDYLIETACIYICAMVCFRQVKFYVLNIMSFYCKAARALVHCQRYALMQMFNYYYYLRNNEYVD